MELLLTGSTGFVGRNLLRKLLLEKSADWWSRIILPVRDPGKLRSQLAGEGFTGEDYDSRLEVITVSGDAWDLQASVHPDLVIHAAGRLFGRAREGYFQTNVAGSIALARQLPAKVRVIALSSLAAGGPTPEGVATRSLDDADAPVSYYGDSKLAMERELRDLLGERLLILRPPMVLGPRDTATEPLFQMAKGLLWVKPGLHAKEYSWIAVEDLCEAILATARRPWPSNARLLKPFYLSSKQTITDTQLLTTAAGVIGSKGLLLPVPQFLIRGISLMLDTVPAWREAVPSLGRDRVKEILPDRWVASGEEFEHEFGWQPRHSLAETLRATAEWLKAQRMI